MRERLIIVRFRPGIESLEAKQLMSAGHPAAPHVRARLEREVRLLPQREAAGENEGGVIHRAVPTDRAVRAALLHHRREGMRAGAGFQHQPRAPVKGITVDRITNPTPVNTFFVPPFKQIRVQSNEPVPGQQYNVLFLSLFNRTGRTFTANDKLAVRLTMQDWRHSYPLLKGNEQWKPRETIIVYLLTKKSYTGLLAPPVSAGFSFNFTDPRVVAIPGPSGFFQRITYNPATFPRVLSTILLSGPGARGLHLGMPVTNIWEAVPTNKADIL